MLIGVAEFAALHSPILGVAVTTGVAGVSVRRCYWWHLAPQYNIKWQVHHPSINNIHMYFQTSTDAYVVPSVATFWYPFRINGHNIFVVIIILIMTCLFSLSYYYLGKWNYNSQTWIKIYILTIIKNPFKREFPTGGTCRDEKICSVFLHQTSRVSQTPKKTEIPS